MKRLYAFLIAAALCFPSIGAMAWWQSIQQVSVSAAPTYQGPGDVVSGATFWGSCARAYSQAKASTSTSFCDLVDSAAPTTVVCTLRGTASGFVDLSAYCAGSTPAVKCATLTNSVCVVSQVYDQTGNSNHMLQATGGRQPALTFSALNSLPGMTLIAATPQFLSTAGNFTNSQPYTMSGVLKRTGSFTSASPLMGSQTSNELLGFNSVANQAIIGDANGGTNYTATANDSVFHSMNGVFNGASSLLNVDGASTSGTVTATVLSGQLRIARWGGGSSTDGIIMEAGFWPSAFTSGNNTSMNTNQHSSTNGYNF